MCVLAVPCSSSAKGLPTYVVVAVGCTSRSSSSRREFWMSKKQSAGRCSVLKATLVFYEVIRRKQSGTTQRRWFQNSSSLTQAFEFVKDLKEAQWCLYHHLRKLRSTYSRRQNAGRKWNARINATTSSFLGCSRASQYPIASTNYSTLQSVSRSSRSQFWHQRVWFDNGEHSTSQVQSYEAGRGL